MLACPTPSGKDIPKLDDDSACDVFAEVYISGAKQEDRLGWGLVAPKGLCLDGLGALWGLGARRNCRRRVGWGSGC